ncbi:hypothetical protein TGAM01_v202164 [Trichoderma gamsii]|uniref:Uncharacterized protein n=1 Tax=Trichoderma gamsii TaxID=398673 RepID=A0A2P4ZXQ3_9HYPO|nr:hypothetical protein TGAM01_v202164 [Trichoderma gamsii]PON29056.1 hypothetical protein TGAM01_v202164 [Trichoderma gamsii]
MTPNRFIDGRSPKRNTVTIPAHTSTAFIIRAPQRHSLDNKVSFFVVLAFQRVSWCLETMRH